MPAWAAEAKADPHRRAGRFLLGPILGQGGMGTVYEAWDPFLKRLVAIKFLHRDTSEAILRFLREAELQARVTHPNICPIHEVDASGELPMIVMQRLYGPTLWELRGQLAPRALAEIMEAVARAIHAAHQARMIHRDIKPANIILEPTASGGWHPFVVDFGLARALDSNPLTCGPSILGTPAYMPREQSQGRGVDARTDVYALGVTFSVILGLLDGDGLPTRSQGTGSAPASGPAPKVATGPLGAILERAMEENPEDRYQTAEALADELRRFLDGAPIHARRTWPRLVRQLRRNRALAGALVLSLAAVSASALYAGRVWTNSRIRLEAASRFEEEIKGLEGQARHARTQRPHDIRPELARIQGQLTELQAQVPVLPYAAQGPALFALGRGSQLLRRPEEALVFLRQAWDHGYQAPQVAYALGTTLAQLYEGALIVKRHGKDPEIRSDPEQRFAGPAVAYLEKARGRSAEAPSYPMAILAFCKRDLDLAVKEAQAAIQEVPWLYEARFLEGRVQTFRYFQSHEAPGGAAGMAVSGLPESLAKAQSALQEALVLAPCDEAVLAENLDFQSIIAIWRSEHGVSDLATFDEGLRLGGQAMAVNPENERLRGLRLGFMTRWAYAAMAAGKDPCPELKAIRNEAPPSGREPAVLASWTNALADQALVQAEYEWCHGADPMPTLAWAEAQCRKATLIEHAFFPDRADILLLRADVEAERGQNPAATLEELRSILREENHWTFFYPWDVQGLTYACQARFDLSQGRDPGPALAQSREALEQAMRLAPGTVHPHVGLASTMALGALDALRRGQPAGLWVQPALEHARVALARGPAFPSCRRAMGEVLTVQALQELVLGRDARPVLESLRTSASQGLKAGPGQDAFERSLALADFIEACQGSDPAPRLKRALDHARRSLAIKSTTPETRQLLEVIRACGERDTRAGLAWLRAGMPASFPGLK